MRKGLFLLFLFASCVLYGQKSKVKTPYTGKSSNYSGLQMPVVYSDNMVLQRNIPLNIQGSANAGNKVTVEIYKQKHTTKADVNGKWEVTLNPMKEGGPHTLKIKTDNDSLIYKNVLVGEVWLFSGQSNMEFYLKHDADYDNEKLYLNNRNIRLFNMVPRWKTSAHEWDVSVMDSLNSLQYFNINGWKECNNKTAEIFSAVSYYFGKTLSDSLNVPIGLILNAVGGSPAEAWIDRNTMENDFPEILKNWTDNDLIQDWVRERALLNIKKSKNEKQRHPYEPCYLFESGIMPLLKYTVGGVLWYQGESNAHNIEAYEKLFNMFVYGWRKYWDNDNLPFIYVQLSSLNRPSWPAFRDSQRKLMNSISSIYMTVSSDRGDSTDVHPRRKKDIGERSALWALNKVYGKNAITPSGPLYNSVTYKNGFAYISFDYNNGMKPSDGNSIIGFETAEADGAYYPAEAVVEGDQIKVWVKEVKNPEYIRYGWQPYTRANIVNSSNLPAPTFKTEN